MAGPLLCGLSRVPCTVSWASSRRVRLASTGRIEARPGWVLPVALAACRGVDQAAELGGVVVDELDEPGVTSHRVPFADEDREQVQAGPGVTQ